MIVLGVDPHKATHTVVAVDGVGRKLGERTACARSDGHQELMTWARALDGEHTWAVEDCRHVSGLLERELVAAGEVVVRVPPKLMSGRRRASRSYGKSDAIDALAVARAALAHPELPLAQTDPVAQELKLFVNHRDQLVGERTRYQNRLHWHLHDLDPALAVGKRTLDRATTVERLARQLARREPGTRVELCRNLVRHIRVLNREVLALERTIAGRVAAREPELLELVGCGALTAGKIVGEVGGIERFTSEPQLAMLAATAPLDCSSGQQQRHRLNPYGNRQLNAAIHRIALTQSRIYPPARDLIARRRAQGDTWREAMRVLKRYLTRVIFRLLKQSAARRSALALT